MTAIAPSPMAVGGSDAAAETTAQCTNDSALLKEALWAVLAGTEIAPISEGPIDAQFIEPPPAGNSCDTDDRSRGETGIDAGDDSAAALTVWNIVSLATLLDEDPEWAIDPNHADELGRWSLAEEPTAEWLIAWTGDVPFVMNGDPWLFDEVAASSGTRARRLVHDGDDDALRGSLASGDRAPFWAAFGDREHSDDDDFGFDRFDGPSVTRNGGGTETGGDDTGDDIPGDTNPGDTGPGGFDPVNTAPFVFADNATIGRGATMSVGELVSASDPDGDDIVMYRFQDHDGAFGDDGYFVVDGVARPSGEGFEIEDLAALQYVGGTGAGSDGLSVQVFDGELWSEWAGFDIATFNARPWVTAGDAELVRGDVLRLTDIVSAGDPDGDPILAYRFRDSDALGRGSGFISPRGPHDKDGDIVEFADLERAVYHATGRTGTDEIQVQVFDGDEWSDWQSFEVETVDRPTGTDHEFGETVAFDPEPDAPPALGLAAVLHAFGGSDEAHGLPPTDWLEIPPEAAFA